MILNPMDLSPGTTHSFIEIYKRLKGYGFKLTILPENPLSSGGNMLCVWRQETTPEH
jgi:hypothetical protein